MDSNPELPSEPALLDQPTIDELLASIPPYFSQGQRLTDYLGKHPDTITVEVNQNCVLGNISDVARKVNPLIYKHGLQISCRRPPFPVKNRLGEPSGMWLWGIYQVAVIDGYSPDESAANDPVY